MPSIWTLLRQHYSPSLLRLVLHVWLLYSAVTLVFMRSIIGIVQGGVGVLASIETLRAIKSPKVVGLVRPLSAHTVLAVPPLLLGY
jgi:hypothetical protein